MTDRTPRPGVWRRLSRYSFSKEKISRPIIRRFVRRYGTDQPTLVLHPEEGLDHFPNRYIVSKRVDDAPDMLVDAAYRDLAKIPSESYDMILCVGLLEHIEDPQRFVDDLHRILRPGGRALIKCSSCFSLHDCPDDYFRFTPSGIRVLFRRWSGFEELKGTCGPFTTIGILLQRILMQCEIFPPLRPGIEALAHAFPHLDRFVTRQYDRTHFPDGSECDSMLASNLQVVAVK
jgi:SAM-dependent methyltransferase